MYLFAALRSKPLKNNITRKKPDHSPRCKNIIARKNMKCFDISFDNNSQTWSKLHLITCQTSRWGFNPFPCHLSSTNGLKSMWKRKLLLGKFVVWSTGVRKPGNARVGTGRRDITEKLLKTVLNPNQSI